MKSDDYMNQPPVTDPYADLKQFQETEKVSQVEQTEYAPPTPAPLPEREVGEAKTKTLAQGPIETLDEDALENQLEAAEKELELLEMSPERRYREVLRRNKISLEEARKIIDCIIVQLQPYVERVPLTKNVTVEFRTRAQVDENRLTRIIEELQPRYNMTIDHTIRIQNIAASLVRYGQREFLREKDDDFQTVVNFLMNLPNPAFNLLATKLYAFDRKLDLVFQEGYLENF